jgi:hypothetical protein
MILLAPPPLHAFLKNAPPIASAFLRGYREERGGLLVNVFAATLRTLDFALFVFRKAQDDFKRLLAIFAVKLIAGHNDLRRTPEGMEL